MGKVNDEIIEIESLISARRPLDYGAYALLRLKALILWLESQAVAAQPSPMAPPAPTGIEQRLQQALSELREPAEESPLKIAILGVKRQPGAPEPVYITAPEEYLAAFPGSTSPPPEWFAGETVTVIEVQDVAPIAPLYLGDDYPRIARRQR